MMFYTYILESKKDGLLYVGWTNDLKSRFLKQVLAEDFLKIDSLARVAGGGRGKMIG